MKPRLLDLFCGAGGASVGYHRAGFDVVGVDVAPQPRYPFEFWQRDALDVLRGESPPGQSRRGVSRTLALDKFDAIHASPPCQAHVKGMRAVNRRIGRTDAHDDWIVKTRELLLMLDRPYVIENVVGAELRNPVRLCGSSFGLPIRRHRLFESNVPLLVPPCDHSWQTDKRYWNGDRSVRNGHGTRSYAGVERLSTVVQIYGHAGGREHWPTALDIDWMSDDELREAIPPAYTELIGAQLLQHVKARAA